MQEQKFCRNQKYLDYEIETVIVRHSVSVLVSVEIKSTSITRLKHGADVLYLKG